MKLLWMLIILSFSAHAQWSEYSLNLLTPKLKRPFDYQQEGMVTFWGGVKRYMQKRGLQGQEFELKLSEFKYPLTIYMRDVKKKAPLVVFYPGIYGYYNGQVSTMLLNRIERNEVHVVSLPNFLSKHYVASLPEYQDQDVYQFESNVSFKVIKEAVKRMQVDEIILVGESLGSFVALTTINAFSQDPALFQKVSKLMLLWPPLDLANSIKLFDKEINDSREAFKSCSYLSNLYEFGKEIVWSDYPAKLSTTTETCFSSYLFHTLFMGSVDTVMEAYSKVSNKSFNKKARDFTEFLQWYNPLFANVLINGGEKLKASYFIKSWKEKTKSKILMATSKDDFINTGVLPDDEIKPIVFSWGSHCAPLALGEWSDVINFEITH